MLNPNRDRYLVMFEKSVPYRHFVTDCAFRDGQLPKAVAYLRHILKADESGYQHKRLAGQIKDTDTGRIVYEGERYGTRWSASYPGLDHKGFKTNGR